MSKKRGFLMLCFLCFCMLTNCKAHNAKVIEIPTEETISPTNTITKVDSISSTLTPQPMIKDGCIEPIYSFSYSVYYNDSKQQPFNNLNVPPSEPWEIETKISYLEITNYYDFVRSKVVGVSEKNGFREIWIENNYWTNPRFTNPAIERYQTFSIYNPAEKTWKYVNVDFGEFDGSNTENVHIYISKLFFAKDGAIWAINEADGFLSDKKSVSLLSKYNEKINKFEFVKEFTGLPIYGDKFFDLQYSYFYDESGIFWFIIHDDAIYSYDVHSGEFTKNISITDLNIESTSNTKSDLIFLKGFYEDYPYVEVQVYSYSKALNTLNYFSVPNVLKHEAFYGIFLDNEGRLWFGSKAWMESDEKWFMPLQPEIFLTNTRETRDVRWDSPEIKNETSDGRLWFVGTNGLYWLDLQKEKWCWLSTIAEPPFEDTHRNIWLVYDNYLYTSQLEK